MSFFLVYCFPISQIDLLAELNDEQKQAVTHREGPLMIVAGAGTGKTTVITKRIAWLIDQGLARPDQILALTFTDKAAGEMEERVDILLPYGYVDLRISTFHAFCERLLRDYGTTIGLSPDFEVVTELDAWLMMREHLARFELDYYRPLGNPTKYIKALLQHFSRAKDSMITPDEYVAFAESSSATLDSLQANNLADGQTDRYSELARAYHTYQQLLLENDRLDFGDLIAYALRLLRERPEILQRVRAQFLYVLVDEFQDTNRAQYELVRLISEPRQNITVVGDDDQSIYQFRGASIENIFRFQNDYPTSKKIILINNYRSVQSILDLAHRSIVLNEPRRLPKKLSASRTEQGLIEHLHASTSDQEVRLVLKKILSLKQANTELNWSDFAVLVRSNDAGADFAYAFERHKVPFQFMALSGLYNKRVIVDMLSLLRVVDQPHDSPSMYRVLTLPVFNYSALDIAELNRLAARKGKSLFEIMRFSETFHVLVSLCERLAEFAKDHSVTELLLHSARESKYIEYINTTDEQKKRESFRYLQQLYERMKSFERRAQQISLHAFLEEFRHERDAGEDGALGMDSEAGPDVVKIMTIHSAKGLEFGYVFVVNLVDRKFPSQRRSDAIPLPEGLIPKDQETDEALFHMEEERRLFYVAMTRAKNGLFLTSADDYGGIRKRKLSRFLDELGYEKSQISEGAAFAIQDEEEKKSESINESGDNLSAFVPKQFSFTQLAAFQTCPLQYKFAHILRIPVFGKFQFSFGKTMHNTLHRYFTAWMERTGKKQGGLFDVATGSMNGEQETDELPVTLEELLEMYKQAWMDDWYPDDTTREEYRARGREQLKRYIRTFQANVPHPIALEQGFVYKIGSVTLKGRIDRLDAFEDGVEIIDYKTGSPKKQLERADKEQLYLYQVAARDILKLCPKKLTYVYLEDQSSVSFLGSDDDLLAWQEDVTARASNIRESNFAPTPGFHCRFCDFADICEYRAKE